jgi:GTP-binding protein
MEKFADEALIEVSSGHGGNGCVAFRREKYVPHGGPSGGDGGRGGDVIFEVRRNLRTLAHLRYKQHFSAENGHDGEGRERYGRDGADVVVPVPPGTMIHDADTGELVRDFGTETGRFVFLTGGNGGWGNVHFKSSVNQAPRKALPGLPGAARKLRVELHVMADIGLVGFPNAGKSSLLDRFTNARPKIAPYPFTTKIPNLGVLSLGSPRDGDSRDIVLADIPGLIEGAAGGAGLGIRFLKHISRTLALVFLIDLSDDGWSGAFTVLHRELEVFSPELTKKKRIILGTKLDLPGTAERLAELREMLAPEPVLGISVFSGEGIAELAAAVGDLVFAVEREAAGERKG